MLGEAGSSFQWNYWPKSLTTRASKLAGELSSYYKLMKSYYHQERDYNPFRQTARMDRLIKRSATSAPHLSTGLTAPRWLPFPDILILHGHIPIYKGNSLSRPKRRSFMEGSCSYSDLLHAPLYLRFHTKTNELENDAWGLLLPVLCFQLPPTTSV